MCGRAFFALFVPSIFWSFMADVFSSDRAKRWLVWVHRRGRRGTLGSITGSAITAVLARRIGTPNLLLVSVVLVEVAVLIVVNFPRSFGASLSKHLEPVRVGGKVWAGVTDVLKSRYLLTVCAFLILYVIGSTFIYFQQADIVGRFYTSRDARTAVLGQIETAVQTLTLITQVFLTGRIIRWLGLALTLALLPAISMAGTTALGIAPVFATLAVYIILRRASNFALTNPAMEILFTVVPREEKYKAKNFIETFVYRGGDQIGAWTYAGLTALGLGLSGISFAARATGRGVALVRPVAGASATPNSRRLQQRF